MRKLSYLKPTKRVLICTIVDDMNNYGQRLQAYALCKFINTNFKVDCQLCDYRTKIDEAPSFTQFQNLHIPTLHAKSKEDILKFDPDLIILGSDQVLNHNVIDLRKIGFGILSEHQNIVTYAAGEAGWSPTKEKINLEAENPENQFALDLLDRCIKVSVREIQTFQYLLPRFPNADLSFNIDPVFLLSKDEWIKIEKKPEGIDPDQPFDFTYQTWPIPSLMREEDGVKKIICNGQNKDKIRLSPEEFIWMVHHCRKLFTNAFHGYSFGLIFNKDIHLSEKDNRLKNLSSVLNTESKNFNLINSNINIQRKISLKYLNEIIHSEEAMICPYEQCSGCMKCKNCCPNKAIYDIQIAGFSYPAIDQSKCIECGLCKKNCPILCENKSNQQTSAFIVQSKSLADIACSASGGFVKTLAKAIVKEGGISYGVRFSRYFKNAFFSRATCEEEIEDQCRSKYLESRPFPYEEAKLDLQSGKRILVCGTPCQIAAVETTLGKSDQLITVSLICNSIPSSQRWKAWLEKTEKSYKSHAIYVNMRYNLNDVYIVMLNGKVIHQKQMDNEWTKTFLSSDKNIRPACFNCNFKYPNTPGDFIVGDAWGLDLAAHGINGKKAGVVLIMSELGKSLLNDDLSHQLFKSELSDAEFKKLCQTNWALVKARSF